MVKNKDGMIALSHYNSNSKVVKMEKDGTVYNFTPRLNVSMAWVKEEHVPDLLRQKARMCCGKNQTMFHYTSEINANLWEYGTRHKPEERVENG